MERWEFEKLLSEETKINIRNEFKEWLKEEEPKKDEEITEEDVSDYINRNLDNSYWEIVKTMMDDKELEE